MVLLVFQVLLYATPICNILLAILVTMINEYNFLGIYMYGIVIVFMLLLILVLSDESCCSHVNVIMIYMQVVLCGSSI